MYNSLKEYIKFLEEKGELRRIKEFVDPVLEIACATDIESKKPGGGKALLFEDTGTAYPVLSNMMGSEARIRYALGVDPQEAGARLDDMTGTLLGSGRNLRSKMKMLKLLNQVASWAPRMHKGHAPCQESVQYVAKLSSIPAMKFRQQDGGFFFTLPHVYTLNPLTGTCSVGLYRMQVIDDTTAVLHCPAYSPASKHLADCTHRLPVVVCLGGDPVYSCLGGAPLPETVDPFRLAGFLRGKPVELAKCFTQEMLVPADYDFVIEGYIQKSEEKVDELYPKFHVACISHRFDAVCPAHLSGSTESKYMQEACESIFLPLVRRFRTPAAGDLLAEDAEDHGTEVYDAALTKRMSELLKD